MPTKISDLIKSTVADKTISREEWEKLKPELKDVRKATAEMREVLELWANDEFKDEPGVRSDIRSMLNDAGYNIPYSAVPKLDSVQEIVDSNVTEVDKDFAVLLAQTAKAEQKTTIAVLDGGFQLDHPAFKDKEWTNPDEIADNGIDDDNNGLIDDIHGWDFAQGDKDVSGGDHGSHVSGIATRGTDRIEEIACRVFDPLDAAKVAAAIDYACANGAKAINMSFKVDDKNEVDLIKAAMERHPDVLFVKSAGNDGNKLVEGKGYGGYYDNGKTYGVETYLPMNDIPNMVVVAAADAKGGPAEYTNYGLPYVTVAMRGSEVYSSVPGNRYEAMDGTSMASPNVTAVVAKCLTLAPKLTPYDVRQILFDATDKKPDWKELCVSGGLVNQARATRLAAMIGMVQHEGMDPQAAADKIGLKGEERVNLLLMLKNYPVAIPVRPPPVVTPPVTPTPATDPANPTPVVVAPATDPANPTPVVVAPATDPANPTPVVTAPATDPVVTPPVVTTPATDPVQPTPTPTPAPESTRRRGGRK
ncbi:MAG TPA: S8 family serine peptidase [Myxococcales bacterium]|jgi:subtilisin family serine protease